MEKVIYKLKEEFFFKKKNKIILNYIKKLYNENNKVDFITLISELKKNNKFNKINSEFYIINLIHNYIVNFYNIKFFVKKLIQKFILKKIIFISIYIKDMIIINKNIDTLYILNKIQTYIDNIYIKYIDNNLKSIKELLPKTIKKINKKIYIPTEFKNLDNIILGLQESDLIILASRPGMGKTSLALSLILNIIKKKNNIGLFSLEMSYYQIIVRLITLETKINYEKLNKRNLNKKQINYFKKKINKIKKYKLYIDDSSNLSLIDFKNKCRQLVYKYNVKIIIIDYLQLININDIKFKNREQEISTISRNIKYIAKEFKITIIAISQLSRAVEIRGGYKRPLLSDLRESGAIEQDADIVLLLYRPEYYGFKYWDNEINKLCKNEAELIIAKHRNGKLGNIKLKFIKNIAKFVNY